MIGAMRIVVATLSIASGACLSTPARPSEQVSADARMADAAADGRTTTGAWAFQSSAVSVPNSSSDVPMTTTLVVRPGDLVVPICRGTAPSAPAVVQYTVAPANAVSLVPAIQHYDGISQFWHALSWGVVDPSVAPDTSVSFTTGTFTSASDCLGIVFRGVTASGGAPSLVTQVTTTGGAVGMVTCGPIMTAKDGVAVYSAARTTCADAPVAGPFVEIGAAFGNPYGAFAPSDGSTASATLMDCGNPGAWICTTISLTP